MGWGGWGAHGGGLAPSGWESGPGVSCHAGGDAGGVLGQLDTVGGITEGFGSGRTFRAPPCLTSRHSKTALAPGDRAGRGDDGSGRPGGAAGQPQGGSGQAGVTLCGQNAGRSRCRRSCPGGWKLCRHLPGLEDRGEDGWSSLRGWEGAPQHPQNKPKVLP